MYTTDRQSEYNDIQHLLKSAAEFGKETHR
jgi:hypothetical protein